MQLLCGYAHAQIPIGHAGGPQSGSGIVTDSLSVSHGLGLQIASQTLGSANVVREDYIGVNAVNPAVLGASRSRDDIGLVYSSIAPDLNLPDVNGLSLYSIHSAQGLGWAFRETRLDLTRGRLDGDSSRSFEDFSVKEFALAGGLRALSYGHWENHFGLGFKYAMAPAIIKEQGLGSDGWLLEVGYYARYRGHYRLGVSILNLGKPVSGVRPVFRSTRSPVSVQNNLDYRSDGDFALTPPAWAAGAGFDYYLKSKSLLILQTTLSSSVTAGYPRGLGDAVPGWDQFVDATLLNTFTQVIGLSRSETVSAFQWALGLRLCNHFALSISQRFSGSTYAEHQKVAALELTNLSVWSKADWTWWRRPAGD